MTSRCFDHLKNLGCISNQFCGKKLYLTQKMNLWVHMCMNMYKCMDIHFGRYLIWTGRISVFFRCRPLVIYQLKDTFSCIIVNISFENHFYHFILLWNYFFYKVGLVALLLQRGMWLHEKLFHIFSWDTCFFQVYISYSCCKKKKKVGNNLFLRHKVNFETFLSCSLMFWYWITP